MIASTTEEGLDVAGSPSGIVAIGTNQYSIFYGEQPSESAIWISTSPEAWKRLSEDDALFSEALIQAVAMSDTAVVVAGSDGVRAAIWVGVTAGGN